MFLKSNFAVLALSLLASSEGVLGREMWLERAGRSVQLYPRRFGQEHPKAIDDIASACSGGLCATIAGKAVSTLLAAAPACNQQGISEELIEQSANFDAATAKKMVDAAIAFRQVEKNTPPDFTTNPPTNRNSVFCLTAPKFPELDGLNQAQDPANDPNAFFDPANPKATVLKGSQANTEPLKAGGAGAAAAAGAAEAAGKDNGAAKGEAAVDKAKADAAAAPAADAAAADAAASCPAAVTVTVTGAAEATAAATAQAGAAAVTAAPKADGAAAAAGAAGGAAAVGAADFGKCSTPKIEFGVGFDNRKETSFQPADQTSFKHGSAQAIKIIHQFICDSLTNTCGANAAAKELCPKAQAAADAAPAKTGAQADAFNAVFGENTNFAAVDAIDDQGKLVQAGVGAAAGANAGAAADAGAAATPAAAPAKAANNNAGAAKANAAAGAAAVAGNLQKFAGNLGATPPAVTAVGAQFQVDGNAAFNNLQNALVRSCDVQNNKCANAANSSGNKGDLTVQACGKQQDQCNAQAKA